MPHYRQPERIALISKLTDEYNGCNRPHNAPSNATCLQRLFIIMYTYFVTSPLHGSSWLPQSQAFLQCGNKSQYQSIYMYVNMYLSTPICPNAAHHCNNLQQKHRLHDASGSATSTATFHVSSPHTKVPLPIQAAQSDDSIDARKKHSTASCYASSHDSAPSRVHCVVIAT